MAAGCRAVLEGSAVDEGDGDAGVPFFKGRVLGARGADDIVYSPAGASD
ncbi:MAG TPA: hypothetical protein VFQ91_24145 [Bryobacteraceae bacterium]|nr:hypothetical protein [Bryobacteraceae bacterium]